jgi:hypothetical protein
MSLAFVQSAKLDLGFRPDKTEFRLSNGSICRAVGRARVYIRIPHSFQNPHKILDGYQDFYVLSKVITPLVLGLPCFRNTNMPLWTIQHSNTLTPRTTPPSSPKERGTSYGLSCVKVYLSSNNTTCGAIAMPDIGASMNLMSLLYCKAAGYHLSRPSNGRRRLVMGNGQTVFSLGDVRVTLGFSEDLLMNDGISARFAVIHGLPIDIVLGNGFVRKQGMLGIHGGHLQWVKVEDYVPGFRVTDKPWWFWPWRKS